MSVFIPHIKNYAPFYIQRESDALAVDIQSEYGITVKAHEHAVKRKVKQPYANEWLDRDGDDEDTGCLRYEALTLRLSCVLMTEEGDSDDARTELMSCVLAFKEALRGVWFRMFDSWTKMGFRKVRLDEFREIKDGNFREKYGRCRLIFDIAFKISDPFTPVRYQNGILSDVIYPDGSIQVLAAEDSRYVITEDGKLILI